MKLLNLTTTLLLSFVALCSVHAQDLKPAKQIEIEQAFEALPQAKRTEYLEFKRKVIESKNKEKYFSCLEAIHDAQRVFSGDVDLLFLQGICRAQIHDVDSAVACYNQVLDIIPYHMPALMNMIEINFFAGRYEDAITYMDKVNQLVDSRANVSKLPLLDFKHLLCLTKLAKENPEKYTGKLEKMQQRYTYMDDTPFYYYANALKGFAAGNKEEGLIWIFKAYLIFDDVNMIQIWNKALVDTGYIDAHEIMFNRVEK